LQTAENMAHDNASEMVGSIAYYVVLSIFPLMLGIIALLGFFLPQANVRESLLVIVRAEAPGLEGFFLDNIEGIIETRGTMSIVSIIGLLWAGSGMFGAIHKGINRAWGVIEKKAFFLTKARNMAIALVTCVIVLLSIGVTTLLSLLTLVPLVTMITTAMSLTLIFLIFLLVFKITPDIKTYWRHVWMGALLSAVLFELARAVFSVFFMRFANFEQIYGSITWAIILLIWVYYVAFIIILGAEFASAYSRMQRGLKQGHGESQAHSAVS